eukprot:TRINITY_DN74345_c0_g1_i1.p1 TRINITY_DN74345_c0_g1~~TRINITY_DN74345_c0_g1_i1.p1  ORF type:complete len:580 (-),score=172.26 TRINITY_DN74345_c0_g1_i1:125-1864(-)
MAPRGPRETPKQCFERLRDALDSVKEKHIDPWNWHEYLQDEPKEEDKLPHEMEDPEQESLKPKKRSNLERFKAHLLVTISELNRAAAAADFAYFHMCVSPDHMKDCLVVMGTSGDIDEEMLEETGGSPAKIMAALQKKLDAAHDRIDELEQDVKDLEEKLTDERILSDQRWRSWQTTSMTLEEAQGRLHHTTVKLNWLTDQHGQLTYAYEDLHERHMRARRLMLYKARELVRDKIFRSHPKENLFYAFNGFIFTLQREKEERKRREEEARRDAVEFALRNEVRFMTSENQRCVDGAGVLTREVGRLKIDRRELGCRILYKMRPYEVLEYCLWIWELWVPLRPQIRLEKELETEQASHSAVIQQLVHTSSQLPPAARQIDRLKRENAQARVEKDIARRDIMAENSKMMSDLVEKLQKHRVEELSVLARLHWLDVEAKIERIAVLEREIAEDHHIFALRGMVVDLESRLRKAIDRRKQKGFVVPGKGQKCTACGREGMYRSWKVMPRVPDIQSSASDGDLPTMQSRKLAPLSEEQDGISAMEKDVSPGGLLQLDPMEPKVRPGPTQPAAKKPTYLAVWRPV